MAFPPLDPQVLVEPAQTAAPAAPVWFVYFIQFFKALGFTLHAVFMSLWYAGLALAVVLYSFGSRPARRWAARLGRQMPVIVALGVNLGIVPLLFVQLGYGSVFYPATILTAWFWLAIIGLLIPAYYGVYAYADGLRREGPLGLARSAAGWLAAGLFLVIGFLFANGFSLLDHVPRWLELWQNHQWAGAALGTALNVADPTLWPRWLLMFGLALGTTAVWMAVDAAWLRGPRREEDQKQDQEEDQHYWQWAAGFALRLYTAGVLWAAAAGAWYVFGTWTPELRSAMFRWPVVVLTVLTAASPGLVWVILLLQAKLLANRMLLFGAALGQIVVLALNAASRQVVQNQNLAGYLDLAREPGPVELGPLVMFLLVFMLGLAAVGWMLWQAVMAVRSKGPTVG